MRNWALEKFAKYLGVASGVAKLSKDPSTQVSALIFDREGGAGPWGYNGAPRGSNMDEVQNLDRALKLQVFEHAERNAIFSAARQGYSTDGKVLVVTHFPCVECARAVIQSGFYAVVCPEPTRAFMERWAESVGLSRLLLKECVVLLREVVDCGGPR